MTMAAVDEADFTLWLDALSDTLEIREMAIQVQDTESDFPLNTISFYCISFFYPSQTFNLSFPFRHTHPTCPSPFLTNYLPPIYSSLSLTPTEGWIQRWL